MATSSPDPDRDAEWPPPEARFRAALWRGESHFDRREFFQAYRAFVDAASAAAPAELELARGLAHLAAAGYKHEEGDARGAARQLEHARRRIEPYLGQGEVDVDAARLLRAVYALTSG
jgi:hypothetical protein